MTSVGKGGGAGGPAKGLAPAYFFPLEATGIDATEQSAVQTILYNLVTEPNFIFYSAQSCPVS